MVVPHDQLRIDQHVSGEDKRRHSPVHELHGRVHGKESGHEPEQDQHPEPTEQVGDPAREVVAGLAGEDGQGDKDAERDDEGFDDDAGVVEGGHDADGVGFHGGEAGQEEEVGRVGFALPEGEEHEGDGTNEGDGHEPEVGLDPEAVAVGEEGDGGEDGSQKDLDRSASSIILLTIAFFHHICNMYRAAYIESDTHRIE